MSSPLDRDNDGSVLDDLLRIGRSLLRFVGKEQLPAPVQNIGGMAESIGERERELIGLGANTAEQVAEILDRHN